MTGVEILATQDVATAFGFNWNAMFVTIVISGFFGAFLFVLCLVDLWSWWKRALLGFGIALVISFLIGSAAFQNDRPIEYETQYKVTISDEVQMNEFFDKYEIIDQEGKIYTVRERD